MLCQTVSYVAGRSWYRTGAQDELNRNVIDVYIRECQMNKA